MSESDTPNGASTSIQNTPPLTNDHILLPLPGKKYVPRTLTSRPQQDELTHFLVVYNHLCSHYHITSSKEKCKGIITYCSPKLAKRLQRLSPYIRGDYKQLVEYLQYFVEEEDNTYDIGKVESFTRKWRKQKLESIQQFKHYYRKYLELVGKAIGSHNISNRECNRYF